MEDTETSPSQDQQQGFTRPNGDGAVGNMVQSVVLWEVEYWR